MDFSRIWIHIITSNSPPCNDSSERHRKENQRVCRLTNHRRPNGTCGEITPVACQFHAAHYVGIQKRAHQECRQTGYDNTGRHSKNKIEMRGTILERAAGNAMAISPSITTKSSWQTAPDNSAGFTKAPNLGNAIVDNIRNREDQQSGCYGNTKNLDNFSLKKITQSGHTLNRMPSNIKGTDTFVSYSCFLRGVLEYTTAIHGIIHFKSSCKGTNKFCKMNKQHIF